jgi:hypothetical protein
MQQHGHDLRQVTLAFPVYPRHQISFPVPAALLPDSPSVLQAARGHLGVWLCAACGDSFGNVIGQRLICQLMGQRLPAARA